MKICNIMAGCTLICMLAIKTAQSADWLPITDHDLSIQTGTALDFSVLVEAGAAGQHGRIIHGTHGHLAFADNPDKPQRFFCASQPDGTGNFPDHETADRYARQVRLHGYNIARFHFVENELMDGQSKDFDINPEQLDRLYYFLSALKREGVYWLMDGMSSWNGLYGDIGEDRWITKYNVKLGVYFDEESKAHWRQVVVKVLNGINPYTKLTPLKDPALMGVILVNEGGLNHLVNLSTIKPEELKKVDQAFTQWLTVKYGSTDKAFAAWGKSLNSDDTIVARHDWNASLHVADTQQFYYETQKNTLRWMTDYIRSLGYQGLINAYDNWPNLQDSASRQLLEWVDMHAYQEEPSDWIQSGSTLTQESSFKSKLAYIRDIAMTRYWNKPFTVSEYDQPFWDKSRYEAGLAVGAYSSFQDWDLICRHSGAIELNYATKNEKHTRQAIHPFDIGIDPIARAGETLAALLFARQDVKIAQHKVDIPLTADYVFNQQAGIGKLPEKITNLALITGFGLSWQDKLSSSDKVIKPDNPAPTVANKIIDKIKTWTGLNTHQWEETLDGLKDDGVLAKQNFSDSTGIFQSDTGEIILDSRQQILTVTTEKTEAAAFGKTLPQPLTNLSVKTASSPALLSASSLEDSALAKSKHVLLIYATDARNSDMTFADADSKTLTKIGTLPVGIKNSKISFNLKNINSALLHLYALKLNGQRGVELPIVKNADTLNIDLNLEAISQTPTTYFELATN